MNSKVIFHSDLRIGDKTVTLNHLLGGLLFTCFCWCGFCGNFGVWNFKPLTGEEFWKDGGDTSMGMKNHGCFH